jgi:hypothetical protein
VISRKEMEEICGISRRHSKGFWCEGQPQTGSGYGRAWHRSRTCERMRVRSVASWREAKVISEKEMEDFRRVSRRPGTGGFCEGRPGQSKKGWRRSQACKRMRAHSVASWRVDKQENVTSRERRNLVKSNGTPVHYVSLVCGYLSAKQKGLQSCWLGKYG